MYVIISFNMKFLCIEMVLVKHMPLHIWFQAFIQIFLLANQSCWTYWNQPNDVFYKPNIFSCQHIAMFILNSSPEFLQSSSKCKLGINQPSFVVPSGNKLVFYQYINEAFSAEVVYNFEFMPFSRSNGEYCTIQFLARS